MVESQKKIKPEQVFEIILKRHWLIIIPFCISMIIGIFFVIKLPRIYESKTVILVQAQKLPTNIVQDIVASDLNARISTLSQQILSRSNLEKIIKDFDLYSGPKYEKMFLEKKVAALEKQISVKVTQGGGRSADSFSISYQGDNPEKVMQITSSLASSFIDENLKIRESQAIGTSTFLEDELETMRKRLLQNEQKLKEYRESNMGELPEQLNSNLRMFDNLNERLTAIQTEMNAAKQRLISLEKSEKSEIEQPVNTTTITVPEHDNSVSTGNTTNLNQLKDQLELYRNKYTEQHPDVIRLKKMIVDLEAQQKKNDKDGLDLTGSDRVKPHARRVNAELNSQRRNIRNEINKLELEKDGILNQLSVYKKRVEDTPKREEELQSLQRDYTNIDNTYNSLLGRQLESQIAVNMEKKQKGEQFRILDPASLPQSPVSPDLKKLFVVFMGAGFGIGGALIFLLEMLDTSFKDPEEIEIFLNIPVIATIPTVLNDIEIKSKRNNLIFSISGITVSVLLFMAFWGSIILMR